MSEKSRSDTLKYFLSADRHKQSSDRMKRYINPQTWSRRGNYEFFRNYLSSWYSVTTELDCTESFRQCKASGESFFLRYLHAVVCSANEVEAMRYRIDAEGRIILFDSIDIITPIAVPGKSFVTVRIPYIPDYGEFVAAAKSIIDAIDDNADPYGVEQAMFASGDYNVIHLSAVPKMHFTAMSYTTQAQGHACTHPLSVIGKVIPAAGERLVMPYSVYVDHIFVDGSHLSDFFGRIEQRLTSETAS